MQSLVFLFPIQNAVCVCVQLSHLIFSPFPLFPCDCSPSFLSTTNLCASPSPSPCPALFFFVCLCLLCSIGREGRIKESKIAIPLSSFLFRFLFLWTMLTFHFCPSFSSLSFVSSPLPSPLFSSFFSLSSPLLFSRLALGQTAAPCSLHSTRHTCSNGVRVNG